MPFFFHPDIKDIATRTSFLSSGVLVIYEYLKLNPSTHNNAPDFAYPPLTYYLLGGYQIITKPLLGEAFNSFLFNFSGDFLESPYIYRYLFLLKLPYLFFDLLIGLLLIRLIKDHSQKTKALCFWFFNPINLYAIYMIGQFDIIPTFLSFLAFYLWLSKSYKLSAIYLGLGASLKSFPLLILPFFILSKEPLKDRVLHAFITILVYLLFILPVLDSPYFKHDVLFSSLSQKIFELKISLINQQVSVFVIFLGLISLAYLVYRKISLLTVILATFFATYCLTRYHAQWIVWIMPYLTLAYATKKINFWPLAILALSYFVTFGLFGDKFLLTGLLSPVSTIFLDIPALTNIIPGGYMIFLSTITKVIFACSAVIITYQSTKKIS